MGSKRQRNKSTHTHITDAEAAAIAQSAPNIKGACYMCFRELAPGDQVTQTILPDIGEVTLCTPCTHDLQEMLSAKGIKAAWAGEALHDERHEVSYDGQDFIYRG